MKPTAALPASVTARAAAWLARRDAGFTPADAAAFQTWLAADSRHTRAVDELTAAWAVLQSPRATGQADLVLADLAARARVRHRRRAKHFTWAASSLAAAALVLALWLPGLSEKTPAPAAVALAAPRPERQILDDGSVVELNAGAAISVSFSSTRRAVTLLRGEAHFSVAKDPSRPFVVSVQGIEARAVGTEFLVTSDPHHVQVLVTEGRVAVSSPSLTVPADTAPVVVAAGARVTVPLTASGDPAPQPSPVTSTQITAALAWRAQRVEFSGTPLAEAIARFNRHNRLKLTLADPTLGTLRVSGIFWADDPAGFARLIEPTFSLRTRRLADDRIEIGR
jgi:transmembrane sensor